MPELAERRFHTRLAAAQKLLDPAPSPVTPPPAIGARSWRYRNVALGWKPELEAWNDPRTAAALDAVITRDAGARVLGTCWGMSRLGHPPQGGNVLLARPHFTLPGSRAEVVGDLVRCGPGATFADVFHVLPEGRALANQPGFAHLSVAGSIGTGGHGSGLLLGPLLDLVAAITITRARPAGDGPREVTLEAGHPELVDHVVHLGRLGAVSRIDLRTVEAFNVAESRAVLPLGAGGHDWRRALRNLIRELMDLQRERAETLHSIELWIAPYPIDGVLTVAVGVRERTDGDRSPPWVMRPATLRDSALVAMGETFSGLLRDGLRGAVPWVLRAAVASVATTRPVIMSSREGLDFGAPNEAPMTAFEAAMPAADGAAAVEGAIEELVRLAGPELQGPLVFAPLGVRFVGAGPDVSLSPHARRAATVHLEMPTFAAPEFGATDVLRPLQHLLATRYRGRPHWGQRVDLDAAILRDLWPEELVARAAALVERWDPRGDLANPLLDAVLGLPVRSSGGRRG